MCFCTFENVKKCVFRPTKMDFFRNFNSLCAEVEDDVEAEDPVENLGVLAGVLGMGIS